MTASQSLGFVAILTVTIAAMPIVQASCAIEDAARCISQRAPDGTLVQFPRLHWNVVANAARDPSGSGFQIRYLHGGMTRVTRNANAAALGIPGLQVSGLFYQPARTPPIVFARYAPGSNALRVDVLRIERGIDGRINVADAVYGPHQGERFIARQGFISASAQQAGLPGINPLASWKSDKDNVFHDICLQCPDGHGGIDASTSGVAVAMGVAMRQVGAQLGILAAAREWIDVQEDSSGGLLWSTVTVKVSGYARPDWWIASPIGAQIAGATHLGTCALAGESPCRPEHVVNAGIQLTPWAGPGLPTDQDRLYYSENSQSGFTVLGYSLITAALVGFGAYAWGGDILGADGLSGSLMTTPANGVGLIGSAGVTGMAGGLGYMTASDVMHPSAPDQQQDGYLGRTISSGQLKGVSAAPGAQQSLQIASEQLQIERPLASSLSGVRKTYQGSCLD
ncbi:MAG: hypothetical protein KGI67_15640, partial [Pseudomonadota bacterium]|nr:hypothetical protein [Pseudomonadota bacterium]